MFFEFLARRSRGGVLYVGGTSVTTLSSMFRIRLNFSRAHIINLFLRTYDHLEYLESSCHFGNVFLIDNKWTAMGNEMGTTEYFRQSFGYR